MYSRYQIPSSNDMNMTYTVSIKFQIYELLHNNEMLSDFNSLQTSKKTVRKSLLQSNYLTALSSETLYKKLQTYLFFILRFLKIIQPPAATSNTIIYQVIFVASAVSTDGLFVVLF